MNINIKMNISRFYYFAFLSLLLFNFSCFQEMENDDQDPIDNGPIILQEAFPNLSFSRPVDFQHAGDGTDRIFIVEQRGEISVFQNDTEVEDKTLFLNIESKVNDQGNEEGLLGLAFHPDYENNGFFFVNYTAASPRRTVISRFQVSATDPNRADESSELVILEFNQPYTNHNGGQLSFGPDGYLYIASGDGGSGGDPLNHGQRPETLLGAILRIDINKQEGGGNYAIPVDNPFVNNEEGFKEEIYAYGLRNPWRFSFDPQTNTLWTGDVGQNRAEEIDIILKGGTMDGGRWKVSVVLIRQVDVSRKVWKCPFGNIPIPMETGQLQEGLCIEELKYRNCKVCMFMGILFQEESGPWISVIWIILSMRN
jgi:hypothetical protein